jgi:ActR/RegA family two-component response regulator
MSKRKVHCESHDVCHGGDMQLYVLVVDDEEIQRNLVASFLENRGYRVDVAGDVAEAEKHIMEHDYHVVITDKNMPMEDGVSDRAGLAVLEVVNRVRPYCEVIIVTGFATVDTAIEAIKLGAFEYMQKPINMNHLHDSLLRIENLHAFLNPGNIITMHKLVHNDILQFLDGSFEGDKKAMMDAAADTVDTYINILKRWEKVILSQRENLGTIARYTEEILEQVPDDSPVRDLMLKISEMAENRV